MHTLIAAMDFIGSLVGTANFSVSTWALLHALPASVCLHDSKNLSLHRMPYQHSQRMHAALPAPHVLM